MTLAEAVQQCPSTGSDWAFALMIPLMLVGMAAIIWAAKR